MIYFFIFGSLRIHLAMVISWPPGANHFVKLSCGPERSPMAWPFGTG